MTWGCKDIHALGTVKLDHCLSRDIRESNGHHGLVFAIYPGAMAEVSSLVLLDHLRDPTICQNVSCVDEPIKHLRGLLDEVRLVGVVLHPTESITRESIHNSRHKFLRHQLVNTCL